MNRQRIDWLEDFLVTQMNHWIIITILMTVMRFFNYENPKLLLWIGVGFVPFLLYLVRSRVNHFFLFYLIHLLVPGIAVMLPVQLGLTKNLLVVLAIVYAVLSVWHRMHSPGSVDAYIPPILACGIGFAMYFLYHYQNGTEWDGYYLLAVLTYLGLYYIIFFLEQYQRFLIFNKSSAANIPEKAMLRSGLMQVGFFVFLAVVIMLLLSNLQWLEFLIGGVKAVFIAILKVLFSGFEPAPKESVGAAPNTAGEFPPIPEGSETALVWIVLEYIAMFLFVVGVVVGIIVGLMKIWVYLRSHFGHMSVAGAKQIDENMDIRENCVIERTAKSSRRIFAFLDNREKIRKIFKKKIIQVYKQKEGINDLKFMNFLTARECCRAVSADALLQAYEKARYSAEDCTTEDVKMAKNVK